MTKDPEGHEITEGFMQDYNKNVIIEFKKQALISLGMAEALPTIDYVRLAFGILNSFSGSLTHQDITSNKLFLDEKRKQLEEIGYVLNGHENVSYVNALRRKYQVYVIPHKIGVKSMHTVEYRNLSFLVSKMRVICTELAEYAQRTGFGSAHAQNRRYGIRSAMEKSGLDDEDIGI